MDRFFGFDLGDAESAVSVLTKDSGREPEILKIEESGSFVTAYASLTTGELIIGEKACYSGNAVKRKLRFKSRFLTDASSARDVKAFASGVLGELYQAGYLKKGEDCCVYVGCPAGWDKNAREQYREIFEEAGYPPEKIVSESRAALVSACQSRHLQIGHDILSKPVLVVDIGSSTTDFAFILGGHEVEMKTAGEVRLGGGIMDEILLDASVSESSDEDAIRKIFAESEPWKNYCEFAARRLKEKYFSDEEYWSTHECVENIIVRYDRPRKLTLRMDPDRADLLMNRRYAGLKNRSFKDVFMESLTEIRKAVDQDLPELLFLTGGVSRLPEIRRWCRESFPESIVVTGREPEYSVCRGLAYSGRIDEELREFRKEIDQLKSSSVVEDVVEKHITSLYRDAVDALVDPILEHAAMPVFECWRNGEIKKLSETDKEMELQIEAFLHTDEARELLAKPITGWLKTIADELEDHTMPICIRYHVPYTALSLNSYLSVSDIDIRIDAKNVFAVEEITWLIDSIISILIGLLCGGSGVALVSSGPVGIMAGALVSLLVLVLGKDRMENALLDVNIPRPMRKLIPRNSFRSRMGSIGSKVRQNFYESLEKDNKKDEISARMVDEISEQIEICLTKMAEVVEIPLG